MRRSSSGIAFFDGIFVTFELRVANEDPHPALRATLSRCGRRGPEEPSVDPGEVILA
jgi:hypothetical protein